MARMKPFDPKVLVVHKLSGGRAYGFYLACQPLKKSIRGLYSNNWDKVTCSDCIRQKGKAKDPERKSPQGQ